ncbi:nucleoside 2-deoxyribosyltransferase [Halarchaeum acidiphilum MH1-52-1]|uniref:Nucleoside 2-deoxyribosyltransferase n=1 Tax=Halarchaeum acidiphilum MH1-52-1 TaxID=1261545 RepID=U3A511_9EURY|nr:nucleoside 2-deoxyribosyltransferase [Halarchaeum acidiphilum]GAD52734.1 nucleoside 2-deoxyribosyltransferase [Halarchaeum acidiphilum MH1-52-1]
MDLYLAAPLFNLVERSFNEDLTARFEDAGHDVFLPQRDGIESLDDPEFETNEEFLQTIFELDRDGVLGADAVVAVLDGRVPDEGVMVELGIAYENDVPIFGLKTDDRVFTEDEPVNAMLHGVLASRDDTVEDLVATVDARA